MSAARQLEGTRTTPATAAEVLADLIAAPRPRSIQELTRPGRSGSTVARAVAQLASSGLIAKADVHEVPADARPHRGRPIIPVKVQPRLGIVGVLVVDIDNEPAKLVGTVTDLSGRPLHQDEAVTVVLSMDQRTNAESMATAIAALAREMIERARHSLHILGVGVSIGGHVRDGVVQRFPGVHWPRFDLQGFLHERLGSPIRVDNDTTALALRLALHGHAADSSMAVICIFGDGIGGGLLLNGKVWRGARGLPVEPGHVSVDSGLDPLRNSDGDVIEVPKCRCGSSGCLEAYAAPTRMLQLLRAADPGGPLTLEQAGDQPADHGAASMVFRIAGQAMGRGISNIINTVDPSAVWVFAPPVLASPARASAASEWQVEMERAVEANDFGPRELTPPDRNAEPWLRRVSMTLPKLEATCAQAAACLITEAVLAQLDGAAVAESARVDLEACQGAVFDGGTSAA